MSEHLSFSATILIQARYKLLYHSKISVSGRLEPQVEEIAVTRCFPVFGRELNSSPAKMGQAHHLLRYTFFTLSPNLPQYPYVIV